MDNTIKKNNKLGISRKKHLKTVNYNGKYIDVNTVRNKAISIGIALIALAASFFAIFLF